MAININDDIELTIIYKNFGKSYPNKVILHGNFNKDSFLETINSQGISNSTIELIPDVGEYLINEKRLDLLSNDIYCSYLVIGGETPSISDVIFFYKTDDFLEEVMDIITKLSQFDISENKPITNFSTIKISSSVIEIEPKLIGGVQIEGYSKRLRKKLKRILKSNHKINLIWGDIGSGKTNAVKWIIQNSKQEFLYIPNNLIEQTINNPEFKKIIKSVENPTIILDDCEYLMSKSQYNKFNFLVSNILQLVGGLSSEEVNFILVFNTPNIEEIDEGLLNSNLVNLVEFRKVFEKNKRIGL
jgi:hypothetical protein